MASGILDWAQPPHIETTGQQITYVGGINATGADSVVQLIETGRYKTLRIESRGGDVVAGMKIGRAVYEQRMNVIVSRLCASSCANYIFTAASEKRIDDGGLVLWHGDVRQWNFMEDLARLEALAASTGLEKMSETERRRLAAIRLSLQLQDDFYALIGVKDGFARLGHHARPRLQLWALTVAQMESFGIRNVDAPEGYGTPKYCAMWSGAYPAGSVTCLADVRALSGLAEPRLPIN